jgi:hypothetical protein
VNAATPAMSAEAWCDLPESFRKIDMCVCYFTIREREQISIKQNESGTQERRKEKRLKCPKTE